VGREWVFYWLFVLLLLVVARWATTGMTASSLTGHKYTHKLTTMVISGHVLTSGLTLAMFVGS